MVFVKLKKSRRRYCDDDSVWELCSRWQSVKHELLEAINKGKYQFSPVRSVRTQEGTPVTVAEAKDAVLLKALAIMLTHKMKESGYGHLLWHMVGNGGIKKAVRSVQEEMNAAIYRFAFKTDVKDYYASVNHQLVYAAVNDLWQSQPPAWVRLVYGGSRLCPR